MKIILISPSVHLVGATTHIYNLARLLNDNDLLDSVICSEYGWLTDVFKNEKIPFVVLKISFHPKDFLKSNHILFRFLKSRIEADVIHLHGRFPLFTSIESILLLRNKHFVLTVHQFINTGSPGLLHWKSRLESFLFNFMKGISCVSNDLKKEVTTRIFFKKKMPLITISNWIQPIHLNKKLKKIKNLKHNQRKIKLCSVGRLSREKGFDILIRSLGLLKLSGYIFECDIFGEGTEKKALATSIKNEGLLKMVFLRGNSKNIRHLLPRYSALIVPSRSESFGIVVLEAYDAGIPVIVSNIPGLRSIVHSFKTGLLFEANNPDSLAKEIKTIIESDPLRQSLVTGGRNLLKKYYLPNKNILSTYKYFYRLASEIN